MDRRELEADLRTEVVEELSDEETAEAEGPSWTYGMETHMQSGPGIGHRKCRRKSPCLKGNLCSARALHATFRLCSPQRAPKHTPWKRP